MRSIPRHIRIAVLFVVALSETIILQAQTFTDDTFTDANWTAVLTPCSIPGSRVVSRQDPGQGNPPDSRTTTHYYTGSVSGTGIIVAHIRAGATYDPSTQGSIKGIAYSYDLRHYTGPSQWAVAYSPLILQNDSYYRIKAWDNVFPDLWTPFSGSNLTASDFIRICGSASEHPDFSCTGSRIDFGYVSANSNPNIGSPEQARLSGIDNWRISVDNSGGNVVVSSTVICPGDSVTLSASGFVSYQWSPSTGLSCPTCPTTTARPAVTTTYSLDAVDPSGCSTRIPVTISVLKPRAPSRTDLILCLGDSIQLPSYPSPEYQWSPAVGLSCEDCSNPIARPLISTTYVVQLRDSNGCSTSDTVAVKVLPIPVLTLAHDVVLCRGDSILLNASGADTYLWSPSTGLGCTDCSSPLAYPDSTTLYHVYATSAEGCSTYDSVLVEVRQPRPGARAEAVLCRGDSVLLNASGGTMYQWSPATGLSCTDCSSPLAFPDSSRLYIVQIINGTGCSIYDSVFVKVQQPSTIVVRVSDSLIARPGTTLRIPILVEGDAVPGMIDAFDLSLSYVPGIIRIDSLVLAGTLCEGWSISGMSSDHVAARFTAHVSAPPGVFLGGGGTLMEIVATAYLGSVDSSTLKVEFETSGTQCLLLQTMPGMIRLDSVCGISYRLIGWMKDNYVLDGNRPNPFNPSTEISFSIGLDAPTTLEVFDGSGRRVATLIDRHLEAGRYSVVWDASTQSSGIYRYLLRSGTWSAQGNMVLVK